ncbi:ankyrin repeat containing protein [Finch poxvirus]|uniref:Ankyrin repeat containing protein n=2 Tax=unclassified Avipoxvirus TaxID=336487 RepID=A0AAT9UQ43_9POXV|nr:ankyrin repeat containing protein [Finch poxvirus]UOX39068.1 ankyrin repeat containing protein [Finch poxvirus]
MEIFESIDSKCINKVRETLSKGVNLNVFNYHGYTPLQYAVELGNPDIVEVLLSRKADPNIITKDVPTALSIAVKLNNFDIAELLLKYGADPDIYNEDYKHITPIEHAVNLQNTKIVKLLLDYGADIGEIICRPECLINNAAASGNLEITRLLIEAGANVNSRGLCSLYTLHHAIRSGNYDVVAEVLVHGAEVNAEDDLDYISLHHAVLENSKEIVELLIDYGANINLKDFFGRTPLFLAAKSCYADIVELLLKSFADVSITSGSGNTPLRAIPDITSDVGMKTAELIISYIMLIHECNYRKISNKNSFNIDLYEIENNSIMKDLKEQCVSEIKKMRNTLLGFKRKSMLSLCLNCSDDEISECFKCMSSKGFVIYKTLIDDTIERGKIRYRRLNQAIKVIEISESSGVLSNWMYLPEEIKYKVVKMLNDKDLEKIIY